MVSSLVPSYEDTGKFAFYSLIMSFAKGLIFSLDGIIVSYLKSPFGQLSYAINSCVNEKFMDENISDKLIRRCTTVSECCKEAFKKFGTFTVMSAFKDMSFVINRGTTFSQENINYMNSLQTYLLFGDVAIFMPVFFGIYDSFRIRKLIDIEKIKRSKK
jgi:hypothetical protein